MITDPQVDICSLKKNCGSVSIGRGHWRGWLGLYYCVQALIPQQEHLSRTENQGVVRISAAEFQSG